MLEGLLAFPLTPFDADLTLDLSAYAEGVDRHVEDGASAVFLACGTGEFSALSGQEVLALLAAGRDAAAGRVPVWVGAGGSAADARAGIRAAESGGADGVLLLPPYLTAGPPEGTLDYVRYAVAGSSVPVVVYHRGTGLFTPSTAAELVDLPSVVGLKDGLGNVDLMTRIVSAVRARSAAFLFFNGLPTAEVSARAYAAIDVARYSSAVHCFAPEIAMAFYTALHDGDTATTDRLLADFYLPLVALRDETPGFAVSLVKAAARQRGHRVGGVRPPLVEPRQDQLERLDQIVTAGLKAVS
ncbi:5-dehydro-4-deoxyglucarate dehydratase [Nocardioides mangrovicus]|uniref:Probable 5-dehydro-4-deoxyglucarate dehydratase n=1 Tax=Nocardioides mangrovicus TaxID=2478913 RepID=A0A3L8P8D7_9ACTN|nr:5-dehydro-4-deoxyglucarate dehydratase [Nocardioides mangrovicus]RLV50969.1 5-dehydro-4-deoxyglucarate dehydratase [Nocardioides mangrovicus]